tara:strand:- start:478 stop:780 length:303 start_codon:yes stop_codon:yes gene_type:complete
MESGYNISKKGDKTLNRLIDKSDWVKSVYMPSIKAIHSLLVELNIKCEIVESQSALKKGNKLTLDAVDGSKLILDTSEYDYAYKTIGYSEELIKVINKDL